MTQISFYQNIRRKDNLLLRFFDKLLSAFWAGNLDFSSSAWNTNFLFAGWTAKMPMCLQVSCPGDFGDDHVLHRRKYLHKFLIFCVPAADVSGKDTPDTPYSEQKGKQIQDIPAGEGKDNIQNQNKN